MDDKLKYDRELIKLFDDILSKTVYKSKVIRVDSLKGVSSNIMKDIIA